MCSCAPIEADRIYCPEGSVLLDNKCHKIICPNGELYKGICLQAICPPGTVWRGKRCQEPENITTILEIENVVTNEVLRTPVYLEVNSQYKQILNGTSYVDRDNSKSIGTSLPAQDISISSKNSGDYSLPNTNEISAVLKESEKLIKPLVLNDDTKPTNLLVNSREKEADDQSSKSVGCCNVRTPRICKLYGKKWICFNRNQHLCDARVCSAPTVYLRPPEIKYKHSTLIMPPPTTLSQQGID
ncbi:uncharacterized protein LOC133337618, partial [Musca vetustissima]|uniref:uncharacterized protein LOC133337618 n=1 Tax=Musca vetustissima TaxID=27455 RepID=UPI002AB7EC1F